MANEVKSLEAYLPPKKEKPKYQTVNFRFHPDTVEKLRELSEELDVTRTALLHGMIAKAHEELFE